MCISRWTPPVRKGVPTYVRVFSLHVTSYRKRSPVERAKHMPCVWARRLKLIVCSSQEWVYRVHSKALCLRNRTPPLPATCTHHHAASAGTLHLLASLCNNTFITGRPHQLALRCSAQHHYNLHCSLSGRDPDSVTNMLTSPPPNKSSRHFSWVETKTSMWRVPLSDLWILKLDYVRAALIQTRLAKHTNTG